MSHDETPDVLLDWTTSDLERAKRLLPSRGIVAVASLLGRPVDEVREVSLRMGLGSPRTSPRWTDEELREVERRFPHEPTLEIARRLGRSRLAIDSLARRFGWRKSARRLAKARREAIATRWGSEVKP